MIWWILLGVLLLLISWLLLAPLELYINSDQNQYFLRYKGLLKAELLGDDQELIVCRIRVLGWPYNFYPLRKVWKKKREDRQKKERKKQKNGSRWKPTRDQIKALFQAITMKELRIDLDTGNWVTNAKLYPVFWWMNQIKGEWQVNFEHHNAIRLHLRTQPYRLIKAMFNP